MDLYCYEKNRGKYKYFEIGVGIFELVIVIKKDYIKYS